MRAVTGWAVLVLLLAGLAASADTHPADLALDEGNRLFEEDEIEAALEAYARGWTGDGSRADGILAGVLAYNAGTCALRLGRLPEALLWYRRAERAIPGDPWLRDNLAHARRALGNDPGMAESPSWSRPLAFAGVALAWVALLLVVLARRPSPGFLALLALLACTAFAAGMLPGRLGPRAAVLLLPCGSLPAGSEVRVRPLDGGGWRIVGQRDRLRCPAEGVGLVGP